MRLSGGGIALNPKPASGAKDVNTKTLLSWSAGAHATSHNLYLGTSSGAVAGAKDNSDPTVTFVPLDGTSFDPNGLKFDTQYFWRIDAVNDANPDSPWTGPVWNFTTGNFLVVDDFESYTEDSPNRVFQTWIDGYGFSEDEFFPGGNQGNGSDAGVGHDVWTPGSGHPTIMETTTVHSGSQAVPLYYDNKAAGYSEATRTWAQPQDWTVNGFNAMKLYVYGKADNVADALYISVEDSAGKAATVTYSGPAIFTTEAWTEWVISLTDFTGVNMAAVTKMAIGVGSKTTVSKAAGMLLIDDVRIAFKPLGLVAHYKLESNLLDSSGNGHDGTLAGDPNFPATYVNGPTGFGKGMLFEGTSGHQYVDIGTFNPSAATGQAHRRPVGQVGWSDHRLAGSDRQETRRLVGQHHDVADRSQPDLRHHPLPERGHRRHRGHRAGPADRPVEPHRCDVRRHDRQDLPERRSRSPVQRSPLVLTVKPPCSSGPTPKVAATRSTVRWMKSGSMTRFCQRPRSSSSQASSIMSVGESVQEPAQPHYSRFSVREPVRTYGQAPLLCGCGRWCL